MKWTKEDEDYLREAYPARVSLEEISKKINKSRRSISHKAIRLNISRPRKPFDIEKLKVRRKRSDKNYYLNNHKRIYHSKKLRHMNRKKTFIKILGCKCQKCGYDKCIAALEFHHKEGNKEGNIGRLIMDFSKEKALKELKKCILLCANCHRELHYTGV